MVKVIAGLFLILHGLVHLLYFAQSARFFELQPGMTWPDSSWVFSKLFGDNTTRTLANLFTILVAAGFVIGGAGIFFGQSWWSTTTVAAAALSGILYILFWNGRMLHLDNQGGIGILIDAAILVSILMLRWPQFEF